MEGRPGNLFHLILRRVSAGVCVDRRAAVSADGQMSGARGQQMPEVTPTAAFH